MNCKRKKNKRLESNAPVFHLLDNAGSVSKKGHIPVHASAHPLPLLPVPQRRPCYLETKKKVCDTLHQTHLRTDFIAKERAWKIPQMEQNARTPSKSTTEPRISKASSASISSSLRWLLW